MFDRRHLEFLSTFAARNLSGEDTDKLVDAIREAMPSFRADLFMEAVTKRRPRAMRGSAETRVNAKMAELADSLAGQPRTRQRAA